MPTASDYATIPETGVAERREERSADQVLAKLADRLVLSGRTPVMVMTIVFEISLAVTGLWLRTFFIPRGQQAAAAWAVLLIVALAAPALALAQRARGKEPQWLRAAATHEQFIWEHIPQEMRAMLLEFTRAMTSGTRWRGDAHVYIARCAAEEGEVHYAPCCTGGTLVMGGRLLVVLGEHLAVGPVPVARAVLAHERRHFSGWRLHAYALASIAGSLGLVIVGWTVTPWPVGPVSLIPAHYGLGLNWGGPLLSGLPRFPSWLVLAFTGRRGGR
jgi:hypothetical protein